MNVAEEFYLVESIKLAIGVAEADKQSHKEARDSATPGCDYHQARSHDVAYMNGQIEALRTALRLIENMSKVLG